MGRAPNTVSTKKIRLALGRRLSLLRQLLNMTQAQLIDGTPISQPTMSKIEKGQRPLECEEAFAIADTLRVSLDLLFRGIPRTENDMAMALNLMTLDKGLVEVPAVRAFRAASAEAAQ